MLEVIWVFLPTVSRSVWSEKFGIGSIDLHKLRFLFLEMWLFSPEILLNSRFFGEIMMILYSMVVISRQKVTAHLMTSQSCVTSEF